MRPSRPCCPRWYPPLCVPYLLGLQVEFRHDIHAHPEAGFEEHRTHAAIVAHLAALGITKVKVLAGTGLIADIDGEGPAQDTTHRGKDATTTVKCIALRADMDALRMAEDDRSGVTWRATTDQAAHMCGHDGHMASLLGTATLLASVRGRLPVGKTVRLLFQPAEEGPGGALPMIEQGCLEGVDEVYGYHNWPTVPLGTVAVVPGPLMAHVADFELTIEGRGGHASTPHLCIDPIIAAAHVVTALQSVVSRAIPPSANAVLSVTQFNAGTAQNIIPNTAVLRGTIRDVNADVYRTIVERVKAIVTSTAAAHQCTATIDINSTYPVLLNHPTETAHVVAVAQKELGGPQAIHAADLPKMGAEDFAYYLEHRPGCFYFLGGAEEGRLNAICHSTSFDFNDRILPISVRLYIRLLEARFGCVLFD